MLNLNIYNRLCIKFLSDFNLHNRLFGTLFLVWYMSKCGMSDSLGKSKEYSKKKISFLLVKLKHNT